MNVAKNPTINSSANAPHFAQWRLIRLLAMPSAVATLLIGMRIVIPACCICLLLAACGTEVDHRKADDGVLDLRDWDPTRDGVVALVEK